MTRYVLVIVKNSRDVKKVKDKLESLNLINRHMKICRSNENFHIFTKCLRPEDVIAPESLEHDIELSWYEVLEDEKESLDAKVAVFLRNRGDVADETLLEMVSRVPKRWSVYPPMVLFPPNSFDTGVWVKHLADVSNSQRFFEYLKQAVFGCEVTHFAVNRPISDYVMRRPLSLLPLYGDFGPIPSEKSLAAPSNADIESAFWCSVVQNGLFQTWAPRYTMFSRGNIKEKKRILDTFQDIDRKVVVDLYAGIGYFALSYLKRGATVFCWELNPWSIQGLIRGVSTNSYKFAHIKHGESFDQQIFSSHVENGVRVFIFEESNIHAASRLECLRGQLSISHINMGLLPSSQPSWPIAKALAYEISSLPNVSLHIHENTHVNEFNGFSAKAAAAFPNSEVRHLEKVKTYAPDIWHIVLDLHVDKSQ